MSASALLRSPIAVLRPPPAPPLPRSPIIDLSHDAYIDAVNESAAPPGGVATRAASAAQPQRPRRLFLLSHECQAARCHLSSLKNEQTTTVRHQSPSIQLYYDLDMIKWVTMCLRDEAPWHPWIAVRVARVGVRVRCVYSPHPSHPTGRYSD